jgi:hypothetical protein
MRVAEASEVEPGIQKFACVEVKRDLEDFMCATMRATVNYEVHVNQR